MNPICFLTGRQISTTSHENYFSYDLKIAGRSVKVFVCIGCENKIKAFKFPKKSSMIGLITNLRIPERIFLISNSHTDTFIPPNSSTTIIVEEYFDSLNYPKTPFEKMYNFLQNLSKQQKFDGDLFEMDLSDEKNWAKGYFMGPEECHFYYSALVDSGLIEDVGDKRVGFNRVVRLTISGLNKLVELEEQGMNSMTCFIAMKFDPSMATTREAIKRAINKTGHKSFIIDEENLTSDKTIPDAILSGIKKSKFCIADFTHHVNGVYFEAGYALGLSKPVIYVCHKSQFNSAHFDIKQLQHIIYETPEELEKKLEDKINAWII